MIKVAIEEEIAKLGGKSENVYIGGLSQGCAMALHVGFGFEKPLGAIVGLSGFKFLETTFSDCNMNTPVFINHGTSDKTIPYEKALASYERFEYTKYPNINFNKMEGMGHEIDDNT